MIEIVKEKPLVVRNPYYSSHELTLYRTTLDLRDGEQDIFFFAEPARVRHLRSNTGHQYTPCALPVGYKVVEDDKYKVLTIKRSN